MRNLTWPRVLSVVFLVGALVGLGLAVGSVVQQARYRDAVTTTGTVVGTERSYADSVRSTRSTSSSSRDEPAYAARIRYTDASGRSREFVSSIATSPAPRVGSMREVEYVPGQPDSAREASFAGRWLLAIIGVPLMLVFAGLSLAMRFLGRRRS